MARVLPAAKVMPGLSPWGLRRPRAPVRAAAHSPSADDSELDAAQAEALNDLCSRAVRAMLAESGATRSPAADALAAEALALSREVAGDAAAPFLAALAAVLRHEVPPAAAELAGAYLRALSAVLAAVEGAWALRLPGQAEGAPEEPRFATWEVWAACIAALASP